MYFCATCTCQRVAGVTLFTLLVIQIACETIACKLSPIHVHVCESSVEKKPNSFISQSNSSSLPSDSLLKLVKFETDNYI